MKEYRHPCQGKKQRDKESAELTERPSPPYNESSPPASVPSVRALLGVDPHGTSPKMYALSFATFFLSFFDVGVTRTGYRKTGQWPP